MKFPIIGGVAFALSGAAALAAVALLNPPAPAAPSDSPPTGDRSIPVVFNVPDMHCELACAPKVRETLAAVPGVRSVETDVDKQTATVTVTDGFDADAAMASLAKAGYPAEPLTE